MMLFIVRHKFLIYLLKDIFYNFLTWSEGSEASLVLNPVQKLYNLLRNLSNKKRNKGPFRIYARYTGPIDKSMWWIQMWRLLRNIDYQRETKDPFVHCS